MCCEYQVCAAHTSLLPPLAYLVFPTSCFLRVASDLRLRAVSSIPTRADLDWRAAAAIARDVRHAHVDDPPHRVRGPAGLAALGFRRAARDAAHILRHARCVRSTPLRPIPRPLGFQPALLPSALRAHARSVRMRSASARAPRACLLLTQRPPDPHHAPRSGDALCDGAGSFLAHCQRGLVRLPARGRMVAAADGAAQGPMLAAAAAACSTQPAAHSTQPAAHGTQPAPATACVDGWTSSSTTESRHCGRRGGGQQQRTSQGRHGTAGLPLARGALRRSALHCCGGAPLVSNLRDPSASPAAFASRAALADPEAPHESCTSADLDVDES